MRCYTTKTRTACRLSARETSNLIIVGRSFWSTSAGILRTNKPEQRIYCALYAISDQISHGLFVGTREIPNDPGATSKGSPEYYIEVFYKAYQISIRPMDLCKSQFCIKTLKRCKITPRVRYFAAPGKLLFTYTSEILYAMKTQRTGFIIGLYTTPYLINSFTICQNTGGLCHYIAKVKRCIHG